MCHVGGVIEFSSDTKVTNLDLVILSQEHVDGLDISVQNAVGVQILEAQAHLYEEFPYLSFTHVLVHLSLKVLAQILVLTKLHDDIQAAGSLKRIIEAHDIRVFQFIHEHCLSE